MFVLFQQGETFDYPEIVPFRLTHNMVDAMVSAYLLLNVAWTIILKDQFH